jgi:hypothetical protein
MPPDQDGALFAGPLSNSGIAARRIGQLLQGLIEVIPRIFLRRLET